MASRMAILVAAKRGKRPSPARILNGRPNMVIIVFAFRATRNGKGAERKPKTSKKNFLTRASLGALWGTEVNLESRTSWRTSALFWWSSSKDSAYLILSIKILFSKLLLCILISLYTYKSPYFREASKSSSWYLFKGNRPAPTCLGQRAVHRNSPSHRGLLSGLQGRPFRPRPSRIRSR